MKNFFFGTILERVVLRTGLGRDASAINAFTTGTSATKSGASINDIVDVNICRYVCSFQPAVSAVSAVGLRRTAISRHAFRLVFGDDLMSMPGSLRAVITFLFAIVLHVVLALFQTRLQAMGGICEILPLIAYQFASLEFRPCVLRRQRRI